MLLFYHLFSRKPFNVLEVLSRDRQAIFKVLNSDVSLFYDFLKFLPYHFMSVDLKHYQLLVLAWLDRKLLVVLDVVQTDSFDPVFVENLLSLTLLNCDAFLGLQLSDPSLCYLTTKFKPIQQGFHACWLCNNSFFLSDQFIYVHFVVAGVASVLDIDHLLLV